MLLDNAASEQFCYTVAKAPLQARRPRCVRRFTVCHFAEVKDSRMERLQQKGKRVLRSWGKERGFERRRTRTKRRSERLVDWDETLFQTNNTDNHHDLVLLFEMTNTQRYCARPLLPASNSLWQRFNTSVNKHDQGQDKYLLPSYILLLALALFKNRTNSWKSRCCPSSRGCSSCCRQLLARVLFGSWQVSRSFYCKSQPCFKVLSLERLKQIPSPKRGFSSRNSTRFHQILEVFPFYCINLDFIAPDLKKTKKA